MEGSLPPPPAIKERPVTGFMQLIKVWRIRLTPVVCRTSRASHERITTVTSLDLHEPFGSFRVRQMNCTRLHKSVLARGSITEILIVTDVVLWTMLA